MSTTRKSAVFLAIAFAVSWGVCFGGAALGLNKPPFTGLVLLWMMAGPAIAATVCIFLFEKGRRQQALGLAWTPNRWWIFAWASVVAMAAVSILASIVLSGRHFVDIGVTVRAAAEAAVRAQGVDISSVPPFVLSSGYNYAMALIVGPLINTAITLVTEEIGWRGYLHDLWSRFGFWRCSLATGFVWGLWHAPAILIFGLNYPDHRAIGVPIFIVFSMILAPLMTFLRIYGRSTIAPAIAHGTLNAVGGLTIACLSDPVFPWSGLVGIGGLVALLAMAGLVFYLQRRTPVPA